MIIVVGDMMNYALTLLCGEVAGLLSPDRETDQTNVVFLFLLKHDMFYSMYFNNNTMITEKNVHCVILFFLCGCARQQVCLAFVLLT